ncbi:MAG: hypothetical protein ACKVPJ_03535 [Chitinophagales bacterium]
MKKLIVIPLFTLLIMLAGCGESDKKNKQPVNAETDTLQQKHESENEGEEAEKAGKVVLNNGAKWQANSATTEGIQNMLSMVNEYINKGDTDSQQLSENLEKEFNTILQKCTMTGEAHDQLHNFLLPLREKIEQLKEKKNVEAVKDIQSYINNYYNYFE